MHKVPQNRSLEEYCFFVTSTLKKGLSLFADAESAQQVVESFIFFREQGEIQLYGYVVMPDHVHFIMKLEAESTLPRIIRRFKTHIAHRLGKGSIWMRGYWSELVADKKYLEQKLEYIHQNPVKAGLVSLAVEYPWSSAKEFDRASNSLLVDHF